ncbi:hypothetical protein [Methanosphaera sp. WGK6]|uniref:hypothetical protein n=1 Tax=Methanosphaera sp. WGK6 TaxID=1561964 RepID=UPI00084C20D7|nr:hypothetical protein [Methanosphaera sp. WGK6]OED30537.1 hypothetical protein NL43_02660 [Methanosphaera sp. WGK6]
MENSIKDFTVNIKKSVNDFTDEYSMEPNFNNNQKMIDDNVVSSIEKSYDDDYEDIVVDHDDDLIEIDPVNTIDTIRLVKVKSLSALSDELDNVNKTGVPAILDLKYIQERRASEFKKVASTFRAFKTTTNANVVLLGSTKNVVVVTPEDILLLKQ